MPVLLNQAQFAQRHNVTKPTVTAWKKKGLLVFLADPSNPAKQLVDAERSDILVRAVIDPTRGRPRAAEQAAVDGAAETVDEELEPQGHGGALLRRHAVPREMTGLEAARLEEMTERTRRRRIETEQLLGSLVPIAEYERRAGDLGRLIRERTHALIRQHAERLASISDPREVMAVLGEAFDALFNQVADEIEAEADRERQVDAELAPLAADDDEDGELAP